MTHSVPSETFDAVIVGSGFGGSVMAYRLAEGGLSVCLLERGKPYAPGSFPRTPFSMARNFWDPSKGGLGLFDVWSFRHIDAIVSAGLGGGSLIYANVLIRKDERWFEQTGPDGELQRWPVNRAELDPHYQAVEDILEPQVFPIDKAPYERVAKTREFRRAAQAIGIETTSYDNVDAQQRQWYLPLLAVTFANKGHEPVPGETIRELRPNIHGLERQTCRLVGECDLGCNYGSKNSLDYNYLTRAKERGVIIRTLAEVTGFDVVPGGGYVVNYRQYHEDGAGQTAKRVEVFGRRLVLAAGTLGSTYLLLKQRRKVRSLRRLPIGVGFSGNGDLLTFALNARTNDGRPRLIDPSHGPVITSTIRSPDAVDTGNSQDHGFYLQDAGYPGFVDWLVQVADFKNDLSNALGFLWRRMRARLFGVGGSGLSRDLRYLFSGTALSAGSLPLLGMGLDIVGGRFTLPRLRTNCMQLDWSKKDSQPYFDEAVTLSRRIAEHLGAEFREDPLTKLFGRLITVHPLGGARMGTNPRHSVVDRWGEVHGHPGLFVADGSVLPGPVGANPSLTIAALANRCADHVLDTL